MKNELPTNTNAPYDEINLVYGLYKLFIKLFKWRLIHVME